MRELKFRVWDKAREEYFPLHEGADGLIGITAKGNNILFVEDGEVSTGDAEDYIVEQYTGLKDKNGKEIYEGDIVLIDMWDGNKRVPEIGHIAYDQSFAGFKWLSADGISGYCLYDLDYPIREVVGNIHNNPELLEENKNV